MTEITKSRTSNFARYVRATIVSCVLLLTAGCGVFTSSQDAPLQLDYSQTLPAGWNAIGTWQQVNIDGDDAVENLLFFDYDQGQVGGAIYDSQISPDMLGVVEVSVTPVATATVEFVHVPLQPLGYYRPYKLLPSSWSYSYGGNVGHGFLALPEDVSRIAVHQVVSGNEDDDETPTETPAVAAQSQLPDAELLIRGGDTHLTFVWWRGALYGYGVTQLVAEGGFHGVDWEAWATNPEPIQQIFGMFPIQDYRARSLLCRETMFTRVVPDTVGAAAESSRESDLPAIAFAQQDNGIRFCREPIPAHPFYPEGVVMAYLDLTASDDRDDEKENAIAGLLAPGLDSRNIEAEVGLSQAFPEIVNDIAAYATVPALPSSVSSGDYLPTTSVCVEVAQIEDPSQRRWIVFTLRYQAPDLESRLPDRWIISGASEIPTPATQQVAGYCELILTQPNQ